MAPAKFTDDSIASDNNPTESVTYQARVLSAMVVTAIAMEAHSNRLGVNHPTGNLQLHCAFPLNGRSLRSIKDFGEPGFFAMLFMPIAAMVR